MKSSTIQKSKTGGTMKEWYSAKELKSIPGMPKTERGVQKKAKANKWLFRTVPAPGGPGGKRYEYHISSLPEETRIALFEKEQEASIPPSHATPPSHITTLPDKAPAFSLPKRAPILPTATTLPTATPEKSRRIALARLDLIRLWQDYRKTHNKATDADKEFIEGYNTGNMFPAIYEILGEVSIQTLYRWKQQLNGTQDWTHLIPSYHTQNRLTTLSKDEQYVFLSLILNPRNIPIGTAAKLTRHALSSRGIETQACDMTFRRYAERFKSQFYDRWVLAREGQKALRDKVEPFIRRDPSKLHVGDVLVADGHRLNFQVINPFTGKPCRATIIGYIDWKSYDLAGYEIMVEENTQCIASALRQSILRLGKYPKIAYQDNGKAFKSRFFTGEINLEESGIYGLFGRLGIVPVFAHPYNARAKIIEGWFKWFSNSFERLLPSFSGSSIEDKPAYLLRNEQFHKAMHNEYIPTIQETIEYIEMWLHFHRLQPCPHEKDKTIGQVFDKGRGPGVDLAELDDLMMETKIARIGRNGIRFLNADYYNDTLYGLREKVTIRYNIFDLSHIKVYTERGEELCTAKRVVPVHPMARILGDVNDLETLKREISRQRSLEKKTIRSLKELSSDSNGGNGKITTPQVDWQKVIEIAPHLPDKFEAENIELTGAEEHIPEEACANIPDQDVPPPSSDRPERPFFGMDSIGRYEWHLKHGFITQSDFAFKEMFERSDEFRMIKSFYEQKP